MRNVRLILHVLTQKGRGYEPAEISSGRDITALRRFILNPERARQSSRVTSSGTVAVRRMIELAETDMRICAITAAMPGGTGMAAFQKAYPDRFFDVGIAEEHAVTMAAGMAARGHAALCCNLFDIP